MEKHFEREQMLKNMTEEERKKFTQQEEEARKREEIAAKRVRIFISDLNSDRSLCANDFSLIRFIILAVNRNWKTFGRTKIT